MAKKKENCHGSSSRNAMAKNAIEFQCKRRYFFEKGNVKVIEAK